MPTTPSENDFLNATQIQEQKVAFSYGAVTIGSVLRTESRAAFRCPNREMGSRQQANELADAAEVVVVVFAVKIDDVHDSHRLF